MKKKLALVRLLAATVVGLAVFLISVLAAWMASPSTLMSNGALYTWTILSLRKTDQLIAERIARGEAPPKSLREIVPSLRGEVFPNSSVKVIKGGVPIDGWGRPIRYSVDGTSFTLGSYGRDGVPGGTGLDHDFAAGPDRSYIPDDASIWKPETDAPMPSLRRFLFELPSRGMVYGCALSAIVAFVASFLLFRPRSVSAKSVLALGLEVFFTVVGTIVFAQMIMQLHIPTGH